MATREEVLAASTKAAQEAARMIGGTFTQGVGFTPNPAPAPALPPAPAPAPATQTPQTSPYGSYFKDVETFNTQRQARAESDRASQIASQQAALARELQRIDDETNQRIAEQQAIGATNLSKTRGINIRSGLAGSPFAEALKGEVTATTEKAISSERKRGQALRENAQGSAKIDIAKIESDYYARQEKIDQDRLDIRGKRIELTQEEQKQALDQFDIIAKGGVDISKVDEAGFLQGYANQTGQDVNNLKMRYLAQAPKDEALTAQMKRYGNTFVIPYKGADGKIRMESVDVPAGLPPEYNNVQYLDATGQLIYYSSDPSVPPKIVGGLPVDKNKAAMDAADLAYKQAQTANIWKDINAPVGGTTSPYQTERAVRTIQSVDELTKKVDANKGIFGRSAAVPIPDWLRSDDYRNFASELNTLKSNITFGELTAMREASKTGGALGQVSDKEGQLLESSLGALSMTQSPENFKAQLQKVKDSILRWQQSVSQMSGSSIGSTVNELSGVPDGTRVKDDNGKTGTVKNGQFIPD